MEVKNVRGDLLQVGTPGSQTPKPAIKKVNNVSTDSESTALPADEVEIHASSGQAARNVERTKVNSTIAAVNVVSESADSIEKLVKSLDGLATQAAAEEIAEGRRTILQDEATGLVLEIKKAVRIGGPTSTAPGESDRIRDEVEAKLGRVLEFLLPDNGKNSSGIGSVNFTTKESIIQTKTSIESARRQIEELRRVVHSIHNEVVSAVGKAEEDHKNNDATPSVRDVEAALVLARDTQRTIGTEPNAALRSIGRSSTLDLLD